MIIGKNEQALVCWSGGRDSTLILHNLLASTAFNVRTLTITHPQLEGECIQKKSRDKIKAKLEKMYRPFDSIEVGTNTSASIYNHGIVQPVMWVTTASLYLFDKEDLYAGYVRGDDVWHYRTQVFNLFSLCQEMLYKDGQLICPLEWTTKLDVFSELKKLKLLKDTWYCQGNGPKPCKKCISCVVNTMTMDYLNKKK